MRLHIIGLTVVAAVAGFTLCLEAGSPVPVPALRPAHVATLEPGVVPTGIPLVVRTGDAVRTRRNFSHTIYAAAVAEDVLDLKGHMLIPKGSAVEMVVRLLPYYGPGGVGMTELALDIEAINIKGVSYPVGTVCGRLWMAVSGRAAIRPIGSAARPMHTLRLTATVLMCPPMRCWRFRSRIRSG